MSLCSSRQSSWDLSWKQQGQSVPAGSVPVPQAPCSCTAMACPGVTLSFHWPLCDIFTHITDICGILLAVLVCLAPWSLSYCSYLLQEGSSYWSSTRYWSSKERSQHSLLSPDMWGGFIILTTAEKRALDLRYEKHWEKRITLLVTFRLWVFSLIWLQILIGW